MGIFGKSNLEQKREELVKYVKELETRFKEEYEKAEKDENGKPKDNGQIMGVDFWDFQNQFENYFSKLIYAMLSTVGADRDANQAYAIFLQTATRYYSYGIGCPLSHQVTSNRISLLINPLQFIKFEKEQQFTLLKHEVIHLLMAHYQKVFDLEANYPRILPMLAADIIANYTLAEETTLVEGMWSVDVFNKKFNETIKVNKSTSIESLTKELSDLRMTNAEFNYFVEMNSDSDAEDKMNALQDMLDQMAGQADGGALGDMANAQFDPQEAGNLMTKMMQEKSDPMLIGDMIKNVAIESASHSRGKLPGGLQSLIDTLLAPPVITWQQELRHFFGTIAAGKKSTPMRRKRNQPFRLDLKGKLPDKEVKVVFAIDTSGSVPDSAIGEILNELTAITKFMKSEITVVECDSTITRTYDVSDYKGIKREVTGRGGTEFSPVFQYISEEKKLHDAVLIYATDGGGESHLSDSIKYWPQGTIWVLTERKSDLSVQNLPPHSKVLSLTNE